MWIKEDRVDLDTFQLEETQIKRNKYDAPNSQAIYMRLPIVTGGMNILLSFVPLEI